MKKIIISLVALLMAAPAFADVDITCAQVAADDPNVIVSFNNTEGTPVRAFALELTVSEGNIVAVECLNAGYYVYPGSIQIVDGEVVDWGTCVGDGLGTSTVIIEMGSLYEVGVGTAPPQSGDLVKITLDATSDCNVCTAENALRGGVVMEDTALQPTVNLGCCDVLRGWPYPACWDYLTQCHGDCDNTGDVKGSDFLALKNSWYAVYPAPEYDPCADFDRNGEVKGSDFLILKNNWYLTVPANCTPGDLNEIYKP
ncbi:MAG: dockerin type I domain-containing protein [Planctomycetota bacterium]|jgi:hypothetical protein